MPIGSIGPPRARCLDRLRRLLAAATLATLASSAAPQLALAQPSDAAMEEAQRVFQDAADRFGEENYALAMQGFQRSYDLLEGFERQHLVLFNIARCHEELGQLRQAIDTFRRYLDAGGSSGENADETRRRIHELEERLRMSQAREPSGPDSTWLAVAISLEIVGGLAGIASLATGLVAHDLYTGLDARCQPGCPPGSESDISTGESLAWASTILLPVSILGDGDFSMSAGALWTAKNLAVPLLMVINNNHTWGNDEKHQIDIAQIRGRPVENAWIGQRMEHPTIDHAAVARSFGAEAIGPVRSEEALRDALAQAVPRVLDGGLVVIDVWTEL